jgi:hypothetical protein
VKEVAQPKAVEKGRTNYFSLILPLKAEPVEVQEKEEKILFELTNETVK